MLSLGDGSNVRTWAPVSSSWFSLRQTLPMFLSCVGSLVTGCGWEGTLLPSPGRHTWAVGRRHVYPRSPRSPQRLTASFTPCGLLSSLGKWGWQPRLTEAKEQSLPSDLVFQTGSVASADGFWERKQSPGYTFQGPGDMCRYSHLPIPRIFKSRRREQGGVLTWVPAPALSH